MPITDTGTGAGAQGERASGASDKVASTLEAGKAGLSRVADSATEAGKQRLDARHLRGGRPGGAGRRCAERGSGTTRVIGPTGGIGRLHRAVGGCVGRVGRADSDPVDRRPDSRGSAGRSVQSGAVPCRKRGRRVCPHTDPEGWNVRQASQAVTRNMQLATPAMPATRRAALAMTGRTPATRAVTAGARAAERAITAACARGSGGNVDMPPSQASVPEATRGAGVSGMRARASKYALPSLQATVLPVASTDRHGGLRGARGVQAGNEGLIVSGQTPPASRHARRSASR